MELNDYQERTNDTAVYPQDMALLYLALGLAGEAGEVANKVKKIIRDHDGILPWDMQLALKDELGDVLYYVAQLAEVLDFSLSYVAISNLNKLRDRQANGTLKGSGDER